MERRRALGWIREGLKGAVLWKVFGDASAANKTRRSAGAVSGSNARPAGLLVNLLPTGLGVSTTSLRFSWIVPSLAEDPGAPTRQSAYRLQITRTAPVLDTEPAMVWDSGRVMSDASTAVPYSGGALAEDSVFYWRVQVWDQHGLTSGWSDPRRLITRVGPTWAGVPIWLPEGVEAEHNWLLGRTEFEVAGDVEAVWIRATGQSPEPARQYVFRLFVNGEFAGVGPVRSWDPSRETRYNTLDVSGLVRSGRNTVAVLCYCAEGHAFQADIVIAFRDGSHQVIGTGDRWRVRSGNRWRPASGDTGGGYYQAPQEFIDAREEPIGWTSPEFVATDWLAPRQRPALPELKPAATETLALLVIEPAHVKRVGTGRWLVDMGRELVGAVRIDIEGRSGQTVEVRLGEELSDDGGVRFQLRSKPVYREIWTLRDGRQRLEHWGYRAFRWIELLTEPELNVDGCVQAIALRAPWNEGDADFRSSDADLDRVWELCRYSIEALRLDVYQDTPTRERGPYEGDAVIVQPSEYNVQRSYALSRYSTSYLIRRPTWPCEFRLQTAIMSWRDYLATGDSSQLAADYPLMVERQLTGMLNGEGLVEKAPGHSSEINADLVDWPVSNRDGYVFTAVNTVINAWQFAAFEALARIAGVLGRAEEQKRFTGLAGRLRGALNAAFLASEGMYVDGAGTDHRSQHATAFALALGLMPAEQVASAARRLAAQGMRTSVYGAQFLLDALYRGREAEAALKLMTSREMFSWLHMMDDLGATLTMEAWDPSIKPNTTFSHAWATAPANVVQRHVVGVEVIEPGAARVRIAPQPGGLSRFEAKVPTIRGAVEVSYSRHGATVLEVVLPANVRGTVELGYEALPDRDPRTIHVSGVGYRPRIRHQGGRVVLPSIEPGRCRLVWPGG